MHARAVLAFEAYASKEIMTRLGEFADRYVRGGKGSQ